VLARPGSHHGLAEQTLAQDLAHRAALALENARLFQECRAAIEKRDEFMALLAHELRNPLAPILGAAQLLRMQGVAQTEQTKSAIEVIERQGKHLTRLVDDLLDLSRVTHGKVLLRKEIVDLKSAVLDALQSSQPHLDARKQKLTLNLEAEAIHVEADPTRLAQILANLLLNACRYTDCGGKIELRTCIEGKDAVVRVKDTGVGIPAEMLTRIFEPFTQVEPHLDRSQGGLGLGLALVQQLVEKHNGKVRAHSAGPGQGSMFEVRLPLVAPPLAPAPATAESGVPLTSPRGRRVVLIEDNADAREMLRELLELSGFPVIEAENGRTGLELLLAQRPEVAIIDIGLPEVDGFQIAREIRTSVSCSKMKLIALTGYGREQDRQRVQAAGFDAHLVKPVDLDQLQRLLLA